MHPLMDPATGRTWRRAGRPIYETYSKLFNLGTHGWMNVQSCHLNFPFGTEEQTVALHNSITCLLPYLPALTASSPVYEGKLGPLVDNRLGFYGRNQERFPLHAGDVVPEYMTGYAQYKREILSPIYRTLARVPEAARLRHEWVNSRGAIVRFMRDAIEIRILDTQECVRMDIACALFIRAALTTLTRELLEGKWSLPDRANLIEDYRAVVRQGRNAPVTASLWGERRPRNAGRLLLDLLERSSTDAEAGAVPYFGLVQRRLTHGSLSERIRARLLRSRKADPSPDRIRAVYSELADCLEANEPWTS